MARLWTCGFELQSVTAGVEVLSVTGTPTISTTVHRAGAASLRINPSAATQYVEQQIDSGTVKRTLHRFYLRITTLPSADCNIYGIGQSGYFPGLLRLKTTGVLTLRDGFTAADIGTASAALSTGVWYRIELDYTDTAGTAGSVTGAFKGYVNGVEFSSTVCSNINGWSRVRVGAQTAVSGDFHIDDVAVNDTTGSVQTGLPGPGNIVHLKPNAAGDNNLFGTAVGGTAGAGNNYTRISETTPDDATSYNETAATGTTTIDDVNLDSSATAGIGAGERVALVQVGARIGSNAATAASLVYRIKSQAAGTVLESGSVSVALNGWASQKSAAPYVYQLTSYTDPQAGGAWTQALLDTAQIGYRTNVSQATTRRVSALWALVETIPLTTAALGTASEVDTGQAAGKTKTKALALGSETDSGQALARRKTKALALSAETSTAQVLGRRKSIALGTATETNSAQTLVPLAGVPFSALADTFNDGVVDPAKWPDSYDPGGYSEVGGRARVACNTAYNAYASAEAYRLRESGVHVRMWPPAAGGATVEAWAQLLVQTITLGTDAIFEVSAITGNLIMAVRTGYFDPAQAAISYDATAHAWLRIRETGGQLLWDTSPDGITWTNRRTAASPGWVGDTNLQVQLIAHRDGGVDDVAEFDSFNTGASQSAALVLAGEVDTAQSLVGRKSLALGATGEVDSAQAPGRSRSRALAPAGEPEAAQPLGKAKTAALTVATETDQARALIGSRSAALGRAAETGAARPLGRAKASALLPAAETETAQSPAGRKQLALGTAVESAAARSFGSAKMAVLPVAEETATAVPLAPASGLVAAEETSTARSLGRVKARTVGVAGEVGEARPLGRVKAAGLTVAAETATARPLAGGRRRALVPSEETSTARPFVQSRARQLPTAVEESEALGLAGGSVAVLGRGSETDEARPVTGRKSQALTAVLAVESALPVAGRKTRALGTAGEFSTAQVLAAGKRAQLVAAAEVVEAERLLVPGAIAPADETSTARPLVGGKRLDLTSAVEAVEAQQFGAQSLLALGRAIELAGTLPVGRLKTRGLSAAAGFEAAQPFRGTKTCALGRAAEVSRALIGPKVRITPAVEHGQALVLIGRRQQPADHLAPSTSGPVLTPSTSGPGLSTSGTGPLLAATTTSGG
ncbi:hypothetical protein PV735_05285 [Streptomyces turgidiscabies]|uniref:Uncharacterized protein n=1 Tax=Streptomyces turgidiscabies (strain Car8) TaxID=698760 RepID=L7EYU0_STRT8|nr:hypothetical protein [Streptomyces turgidiscabies]ELP64177.1 hypothetical protein STRTUCAR8_05589 [Streptomyces turgidiscabies Car8]MDX3492102.1 hypothetical protein [Streptomyces turgidiscabies]